ncbi:MAG: hypothetical protein ACJA2S_000982 [Cyclobacteriaceae bacterium]|jgi:hypothetical protein
MFQCVIRHIYKHNLILFFISVLSIQSCQYLDKKNESKSDSNKKDGSVKTFRKDGNLFSEINYVNGRMHGISKRYSKRGKLQFLDSYVDGIKNAKSLQFYPDGKVMRETSYMHGQKNGVTKAFWATGTLSSSITYREDLPANDLKEFMKSGKEKKYETLLIQAIDELNTSGKYILKIKFSKNAKRADYYIGELVDGKYFAEYELAKIPEKNGVGMLVFKPPPGGFIMKKYNIIGKLKTARGNILIRQKIYNLAIDRDS